MVFLLCLSFLPMLENEETIIPIEVNGIFRAYTFTTVHSYVHASLYANMPICMPTFLHACLHVYILNPCTYAYTYQNVKVRRHVPTCLHTCLYIPINLHMLVWLEVFTNVNT